MFRERLRSMISGSVRRLPAAQAVKPGPTWLGIGLAACFSIAASVASHGQQPEPEVACIKANEPLFIAGGWHTAGCALDPASDTDQFEFFGVANEEVIVSASFSNFFLDPRVEIRDPDGDLVIDQSCTNCNAQVSAILPDETGIYRLAVSDEGIDDTSDYVLHFTTFPPEFPMPELMYNVPADDQIDFLSDTDFYRFFSGGENTVVRISIANDNFFFDSCVEVRQPGGTRAFALCCTNCDFQADVPLAEIGDYTLTYYDDGLDDPTAYTLQIQCLVGDCDAPPPPIFADGFESGDTSAWTETVP